MLRISADFFTPPATANTISISIIIIVIFYYYYYLCEHTLIITRLGKWQMCMMGFKIYEYVYMYMCGWVHIYKRTYIFYY